MINAKEWRWPIIRQKSGSPKWAMVPAGIRLTVLVLLRGGWMDDIHRTLNISENVLTLNFFYLLG